MKAMPFARISVIATMVFLLMSCKKNDTTSDPADPATGPFVAKVDGQSFPAADLQFTKAKFVASTKMLQIIGQPKDQKETIVLNLFPFGRTVAAAVDWKPGKYDFDPVHITQFEYQASAEYNKWNGSTYDQWFTVLDYVKAGNITIESNSGTHIKGTFSFDAVRRNIDGTYNTTSIKKITNGAFDLDIKQ